MFVANLFFFPAIFCVFLNFQHFLDDESFFFRGLQFKDEKGLVDICFLKIYTLDSVRIDYREQWGL